MDWEAAAAVIAGLAFVFSLLHAQRTDRERNRADRTKFLLGTKETVAFEAGRIADRPGMKVSRETIQALVLAALFERSDRARLQVYRALDSMRKRHGPAVVTVLEADLQAAGEYRRGLDLRGFNRRLGQLYAAVPWTIPVGSPSAALKDEIAKTARML